MSNTNNVTVLQDAGLPANIDESLLFGDAGREGIGAEDVALPFFKLLQGLSNEVKRTDPAYDPDAKAGNFYNSVTREQFDGEAGVLFVPVEFQKRYTLWKANRGGFHADLGEDATLYNNTLPNKDGKRISPDGFEIVRTPTFFGLIVNPELGTWNEVVLPLGGTHTKAAKAIASIIQSRRMRDGTGKLRQLNAFASVFHLGQGVTSNDKGEWFIFKPSFQGDTVTLPNGPEILAYANGFYQAIRKGEVKVAPPAASDDFAADTDSDIPL